LSFKFLGMSFSERRIRIGNKIYKISIKKQIFAFVFTIIICIIIGLVINNKDTMVEVEKSTPKPTLNTPGKPSVEISTTPKNPEPPDISNSSDENLIIIHVSGAVSAPGIVSVSKNARIADVIEAAGGFTKDCDLSEINLAAYAVDGMKIHVPHLGETPNFVLPNHFSSSPTPTSPVGGSSALQTGPQEKININTATVPQLMQLKGIGESTAQKIIAYREGHGFFTKIEDILLVSGIGTNKYNAIKDYICV